jgi:ubiquitin carboxyl-terminal hydrolase L3
MKAAPIPVVMYKGKKTFTVLENNPEVMTPLAHSMGLSKDLEFYDVYSLSDPELLAHIPRPVFALLVILPLTPAYVNLLPSTDPS